MSYLANIRLRYLQQFVFLIMLCFAPIIEAQIDPIPLPTQDNSNSEGNSGLSNQFSIPSNQIVTENNVSRDLFYAVNIISDGSRQWSSNEITEIGYAEFAVASALRRRSNVATAMTDPVWDTFNRVLVNGDTLPYILLIRADRPNINSTTPPTIVITYNSYTYNYPAFNGVCTVFQGTGNSVPLPPNPPAPRAVVCNGNFYVNQYTMVHEFGHIFDNRSGSGGQTSLQNRALNKRIGDCYFGNYPNGDLVMGYAGIWKRGERGWGSGPAKKLNNTWLITTYQQDPLDTPDEAAPDMFLNWVYRSNTVGGKGKVSCGNTGNWAGPGFLNVSWQGQTSNTPKSGTPQSTQLPGDQRHKWMHKEIKDIFVQHPTW